MKNTAFRLTAIGAAILSSHVSAQNTVTLYGVVDTGLMYVHNSGGKATQILMTSGAESGSSWGLKGGEDLGGETKAIFQIQNGFNGTNGNLANGGREFGHQAYIGLADNRWGTLTIGRQYDPVVDLVQPVQPDNYLGGFFTTPGDVDNADNSVRVNNAFKWVSPNWSGLQLDIMYALGGIAGSLGSGQTYSGALAYNTGSGSMAIGYMHVDNGNAILSARSLSSSDSFFNSSVNDAYETARSINLARLGGNYNFGQFIFGTYYSFSEYNPDASSAFNRSEKYYNGAIYAVWQVTSAFQAEMGYDYMRSLGDSSAKYHQISVGADYNLSKRTDIYGVVAYNHATGSNGTGTAQAVVGSIDVDSGKNSQAIATIGLRHKF
jgi:predicted porin